MSETQDLVDALDAREAQRRERRAFFAAALGATAVGAGALAFSSAAEAQTITDADVLNFLLNLEYLEANYFAFAVTGSAIGSTYTTGPTTAGTATGGRKITFADPFISKLAAEIAGDELLHVSSLRSVIGSTAISQPAIDLAAGATNAFSVMAQAAGIVAAGAAFDPYASDLNFVLGAYFIEDVVVSAYKSLIPLFTNISYIDFVSGILGTEGYHAAAIRTTLFRNNRADQTQAISAARSNYAASGSEVDRGVAPIARSTGTETNIAPSDANGIALGRASGAVLNILYLNRAAVTTGGFFPSGVNGTIKTSAAN